jgi:hypothetical protein
MSYLPYKPVKAFLYALLIWGVGFVWGSVVFMTPPLKSVSPISMVSKNPAISFPLLVVLPLLAFFLARGYLRGAGDKAGEGLKLGVTFWAVNIALDLLVLIFLMRAGLDHFASLMVWVVHLILLVVPWLTGRRLQRANH